MGLQLGERRAAARPAARGWLAATTSTTSTDGERVLDEPLAAHVVLDEHDVGVVLLEAILHAAEELDLHLDVRRYAVVGHRAQDAHDGLHGEDPVDHDLDARLPVLVEAGRDRLDARAPAQMSAAPPRAPRGPRP